MNGVKSLEEAISVIRQTIECLQEKRRQETGVEGSDPRLRPDDRPDRLGGTKEERFNYHLDQIEVHRKAMAKIIREKQEEPGEWKAHSVGRDVDTLYVYLNNKSIDYTASSPLAKAIACDLATILTCVQLLKKGESWGYHFSYDSTLARGLRSFNAGEVNHD